MNLLLIIGLIVWVFGSNAKRKGQSKKTAYDAARRLAAEISAAKAERQAAAQEPTVRPPAQQQTMLPLSEVQPHRHPLTPSREADHAHMETSMTGINDVCPPAAPMQSRVEEIPLADRLAAYKAKKQRTQPAALPKEAPPQVVDLAAAGAEPFRFDPARVREGLIYAEILGKPKALRR